MFRKTFTLNASPYLGAAADQIKVGDFNNDDHMDFIVAHIDWRTLGTDPAQLELYLGDGLGNFSNQTDAMFPSSPPWINYVPRMIVADFNGDGVDDIFAIDNGIDKEPFTGGQNKLFLSSGGKLIDATGNLPQAMWNNHGASAGDIDNDGDLDILVNALMNDGNKLLLNNGLGVFELSNHLLPDLREPNSWDGTTLVEQTHTWSGLIDVDKDGRLDMLLGTWDNQSSTDQSILYLNNGRGGFSSSSAIKLPISGVWNEIVLDFKSIDLNGDALPDLAVSVTNGGSFSEFYKVPYVQLLVNQGEGRFADGTETRYPQSVVPRNETSWYKSIEVVDLNRDGHDDMVLDNATEGLRILLNDGTGKFSVATSLTTGVPSPQPGSFSNLVAVGDVNHDGMPDLITSTQEMGQMSYSIYLNQLNGPTGLGIIGKYDASAIYRFFNQSTGTHFYSGDKGEVEHVLKTAPQYRFEGQAFSKSEPSADTIDVARFFNTATGTHFYTADVEEAAYIQANHPAFLYEGSAYQAYATPVTGTTELYRFYNTETGTHFYTTDRAEMESVRVELAGTMNFEGTAFYVNV